MTTANAIIIPTSSWLAGYTDCRDGRRGYRVYPGNYGWTEYSAGWDTAAAERVAAERAD